MCVNCPNNQSKIGGTIQLLVSTSTKPIHRTPMAKEYRAGKFGMDY
jgi:hypothetical protein